MKRDDIIKLAREAECAETWGVDAFQFTIEELERFARLVAAAEREVMQKIAEAELLNTAMLASLPSQSSAAWNILQTIRARGEV